MNADQMNAELKEIAGEVRSITSLLAATKAKQLAARKFYASPLDELIDELKSEISGAEEDRGHDQLISYFLELAIRARAGRDAPRRYPHPSEQFTGELIV